MVDLTISVSPQVTPLAAGSPVVGRSFPFPRGSFQGAEIIDSRLAALLQNTTLQYPLDRGKYFMRFSVYNYHRSSLTEIGQPLGHLGNLIMPLPTPIVDAQSIAYDEQSYGVVGWGLDAINKSMNQMRNTQSEEDRQRVQQQILSQQNSFLNNFPESERGVIQQGIDFFVGNTPQLGSAAAAMLGFAGNQFMTIVLTGPRYKTFELNWTLSPNSPQESKNLRDIIWEFQNAQAVGISTSGLLWAFPKIFRIALYPNSAYVMKFKPSVLTDFAVNYTPGGHASFHREDPRTPSDGEALATPVAVQISSKWLELEYWTEGMYGGGGNNPDNTYSRKPAFQIRS